MHLCHADIALRQVIIKRNLKIIHKRQDFLAMVSQAGQQVCGCRLFDPAALSILSHIRWVRLFTLRNELFILRLEVGHLFRPESMTLFLSGGFHCLFDFQQQVKQFARPILLTLLDETDQFADEMRIAQTMPSLFILQV